MTTSPDVRTPAPDATHTLERRGLLAAGAAVVAGLVARLSETPVSAGVDGDVVLGQDNTSASPTSITSSAPDGGIALRLIASNGFGAGLFSAATEVGVSAVLLGPGPSAGRGAGVTGFAAFPGAFGVVGTNTVGTGVLGESNSGIGIQGFSNTNTAVFGQIPASSSANTIAIYAQNYSTYAGPSPGAGGFAIYGLCANGHGLVGATATAGGAAVVGASNGVAGAYAGAFYGPVIVSGNFTVVGGAKSAAVPHPDGSHRRLYCMESPDSWFEDFGKGQLECGQATVPIDPDFAAIVNVDDYHVFLTGYDGQSDLSVCDRTASGFRVRATSGAGDGVFSWRVVAKRKDIAGARLEAVTIPPEPTLPPPIPDVPTPTLPNLRRTADGFIARLTAGSHHSPSGASCQ
jgi:hypothetical protein